MTRWLSGTWCHACGALLIGRDWYDLTAWELTESGCCRRWGALRPGVFGAGPGQWGRRRMPLRLRA